MVLATPCGERDAHCADDAALARWLLMTPPSSPGDKTTEAILFWLHRLDPEGLFLTGCGLLILAAGAVALIGWFGLVTRLLGWW